MGPLHPLLGALSLATDLAVGIASEGALRTSLAATLLAQLAGLRGAQIAECSYVALLRYIGCSGYAHEEALVGAGDDAAMLAALELADPAKPASVVAAAFTRLARNAGFVERTRAIARLLSDPRGYANTARAHCDIPCGIYDPEQARIEAESCLRIIEKHDASEDKLFRARCIHVKEERAELVKHHLDVLWHDYFKPEHLEKYPDLHETFWKASKQASKVKQSLDVAAAKDLLAMIDTIDGMWKATGGPEKTRVSGRPS